MKVVPLDPPRVFNAGGTPPVLLRDCGRIMLEPDELVTFVTESGAEYDVGRKVWGFYATPSLNGRLRSFGWRVALVRNPAGRYYVLLLEAGRDGEFNEYLSREQQTLVCWLDRDEHLAAIAAAMEGT